MSTKILYIGGSGRTGSTILSMLLSQNKDAFNVGQIRDFPNAVERDHLCACGEHISTCSYWSRVAGSQAVRDAVARLGEGRNAFRRDCREQKNWEDSQWLKDITSEHAGYFADLKTLYEAAAAAAPGRMLVDSSKSAELALALTLIPGFTVYVLNLVRDPRAVTVSWSKRKTDEDRLRGLTREWKMRQKQLAQVQEMQPERFKLLRYEDFTVNARQTIKDILTWTGAEAATDFFTADNAATVSWADQHLFPPINDEVLKAKATSVTIRTADSWKAAAHRDLRRMSERITFPAAERFGYRLENE